VPVNSQAHLRFARDLLIAYLFLLAHTPQKAENQRQKQKLRNQKAEINFSF